MIFAALIINAIGFLLLAVAGERCREALLGRGRHVSRPRWIKTIGAGLIVTSCVLLACCAGIASGIVMFAGLSTVGAMVSVFSATVGRHLRSR